MREALDLIGQGGGWSATVMGMGAVFVSLILLVVFIKVFAAILRSMQRRRESAKEDAEAAQARPSEQPPPAGVTPEVAVAAAIALASGDREEEEVAAVSYAIHDYVSGEAGATVFPAAAAGGEDGGGSSPWSMAGRVRLMNSRTRQMVRGRRV